MINMLTALGGTTPGTEVAATQEAEAETPFASLLALIGGDDAAEGEEGQTGEVAKLLTETEAALSDPDLSDDEISDILAPVLARLGAELAADPALMDRMKAMVAELAAAQEDATTAPASATGTESETPWRMLAEGLSDLQGLLAGRGEIAGDGAELAALLSRALDVATEMTEQVAMRFSPVLAGLDQMGVASMRGAGAVQAGEAPLARGDIVGLAAERLRNADAGSTAQTGGQGAETGGDAAPDFAADTLRSPQTSSAALASAALNFDAQPGQSATLQAQATPLAPVSAMPGAASPMAAAQLAGSAPQMAAPQGQEILGQIRANMRDDGQIKVELKPEGLGKVEIALGPDEAGKMQVVVRADQAAVLSALRADRDGLVALLRDAGHAVDEGALSFSDLGADTGGQGTDDSGSGFMNYGPAGDEAASLADAAQTDTLRLPEGSVDIRI